MKINIITILVLFTTYLSPQNTTADNLIPYRKGDKWGFANKNKTIIIEPIYKYVSFFKEGFAIVNYNGNYGFIKPNGEKLTKFKYKNVFAFSEGLAAVQQNKLWGFIDTNGRIVITFKYHGVLEFANGFARIYETEAKSRLLRYIDKNGTEYWED